MRTGEENMLKREAVNTDLYNTVHKACLDAAQKLGPDIKKLSWFGRFWKGKTQCHAR